MSQNHISKRIFADNVILERDLTVLGNITGNLTSGSGTIDENGNSTTNLNMKNFNITNANSITSNITCINDILYVGNIAGKSPINILDELNITSTAQRITFENGIQMGTGTSAQVSSGNVTVSWSAVTSPTLGYQGSIWVGDTINLYILGGTNASNSIATSPDGSMWTQRTTPSSAYELAYNPNIPIVLAVGGSQTSMTSTNGTSWSSGGSIGVGSAYSGLAWGTPVGNPAPNGLFVAGDNTGQMAYSTNNGTSWSNGGGGFSSVTRIIWVQQFNSGNGRFVATQFNTSNILTSTSGTSWAITGGLPASSNWYEFAYSPNTSGSFPNGVLVMVSASVILTSPDGLTWTQRTAPSGIGSNFNKVVWASNQNVFILVSNSNYATSPDGITWTTIGTTAISSTITISYSPDLDNIVVGAFNGGTELGDVMGGGTTQSNAQIAIGLNAVCDVEDGIALGNAAATAGSSRALALNVHSDSVNTSGSVPYLQCVINGDNREIPLAVGGGTIDENGNSSTNLNMKYFNIENANLICGNIIQTDIVNAKTGNLCIQTISPEFIGVESIQYNASASTGFSDSLNITRWVSWTQSTRCLLTTIQFRILNMAGTLMGTIYSGVGTGGTNLGTSSVPGAGSASGFVVYTMDFSSSSIDLPAGQYTIAIINTIGSPFEGTWTRVPFIGGDTSSLGSEGYYTIIRANSPYSPESLNKVMLLDSENVTLTGNLCVDNVLYTGNIGGKSPINILDELNITSIASQITFEDSIRLSVIGSYMDPISYTTPGNYMFITDSRVLYYRVNMWGGGGGGYSQATGGFAGSGGAGGGFVSFVFRNTTTYDVSFAGFVSSNSFTYTGATQTVNITVGAGGLRVIGGGGVANDGGASIVTITGVSGSAQANGGQGGSTTGTRLGGVGNTPTLANVVPGTVKVSNGGNQLGSTVPYGGAGAGGQSITTVITAINGSGNQTAIGGGEYAGGTGGGNSGIGSATPGNLLLGIGANGGQSGFYGHTGGLPGGGGGGSFFYPGHGRQGAVAIIPILFTDLSSVFGSI